MSHRKQLTGRRVVHQSTGGILPSIPKPVDPVGNATPLKSNTVAFIDEFASQPYSALRKGSRHALPSAERPELGKNHFRSTITPRNFASSTG
jgi:hypothetical protein